MEGKGSFQVKFFKYIHRKFVNIQPEIVEYEETLEKPAFDLIIGTKTMEAKGIIVNFVGKVITIDTSELGK